MQCNYLEGQIIKATSRSNESNSSTNENLYQVIIFGVDVDISNEDIILETQALKVKRLVKKDSEDTLVETTNVVLTYSSPAPEKVNLGFRVYKTKLFIPNPYRCFKCQKFGHTAKNCRGKVACPLCSNEHEYNNCTLDRNNFTALNCKNCNGQHSSGIKNCPAYIEAKNIMKIKTINKISYAEATKRHLNPINELQINAGSSQNQISLDSASNMCHIDLVESDSSHSTFPYHHAGIANFANCSNAVPNVSQNQVNLHESIHVSNLTRTAPTNMISQPVISSNSNSSSQQGTYLRTNYQQQDSNNNYSGAHPDYTPNSNSSPLIQIVNTLNKEQLTLIITLIINWLLSSSSGNSLPQNSTQNIFNTSSLIPSILQMVSSFDGNTTK